MLASTIAASAHHILAFLLVAILATELTLVRPGMSMADRRLVARIDGLYGLTALLLLAIGVARVFLYEKGAAFYAASPFFLLKIAAFLLAGAMSVPPTRRFAAWKRMDHIAGDDIRRVRAWMHAQAAALLVVPVAAALMARGY